MKTREQRFWARVDKSGECWLWRGATRSSRTPWNYGRIYENGRIRSAHVVSYEMNLGAIPDGLLVLHRCDTPLCVRPSHLFLGTQRDNVRDARSKGRLTSRRKWTHCLRGHEFTPENTRWLSRGTRVCRACANARNRAHYARAEKAS